MFCNELHIISTVICKLKYTIITVICCLSPSGDVEDCLVQPLPQGQFTPLPEALCWVILDLTSSGQAAVLERIRAALHVAFPDIQRPSQEMVYDALAKLMAERKVCRTLLLMFPPIWRRVVWEIPTFRLTWRLDRRDGRGGFVRNEWSIHL